MSTYAGGNIAPRGTTYMRKNIYGGTDFYGRKGKIAYSRNSHNGYKYYNNYGNYQQEYGRRIYSRGWGIE